MIIDLTFRGQKFSSLLCLNLTMYCLQSTLKLQKSYGSLNRKRLKINGISPRSVLEDWQIWVNNIWLKVITGLRNPWWIGVWTECRKDISTRKERKKGVWLFCHFTYKAFIPVTPGAYHQNLWCSSHFWIWTKLRDVTIQMKPLQQYLLVSSLVPLEGFMHFHCFGFRVWRWNPMEHV